MDDKNKKKVIFIASLAAVFIVGILFIQLLNSDEEEQKSDEISTPESERDAYNSRTEAFNDNGKVIDLGSFDDRFNADYKDSSNNSSTQSSEKPKEEDANLFADIEKQIANMNNRQEQEPEKAAPTAQQPPAPTPPANKNLGATAKGNSGGGSTNEVTSSKKSRVELRNERLQQEAQKAIENGDYNNPVIVSAKASQQTQNKAANSDVDFSEVDKYIPSASTSAPPTRIDVKSGKPQKFSDLPATEQRRILLQTGQSEYKESEYIQAKIISTGKIKAGQTIRLMLQENAVLSFRKVPRGTTIAGIVRINDNRVTVTFPSINIKGEIIDVKLDLYGTDGILGLPISGEDFTREAKDEGLEEAISRTGRVGRIIGGVTKSLQRSKDNSIDLGNNVSCILRNRNIN